MTKLQCSAVHCEYNSDNRCCRPDIEVGGGQKAQTPHETCCNSFRERKTGSMNKASFCHPDEQLKVMCSALLCEYNDRGNCAAKAIKIGNHESCRIAETECHTFSKGCEHCKV